MVSPLLSKSVSRKSFTHTHTLSGKNMERNRSNNRRRQYDLEDDSDDLLKVEFKKLTQQSLSGYDGKISLQLLVAVFTMCFLAFSGLGMIVAGVINWPNLPEFPLIENRGIIGGAASTTRQMVEIDKDFKSMPTMATASKKLLDGLLSSEFDDQSSPSSSSCVSRYESALIRKESQHKPSSYLQGRLRKYETLHKKCGTHTQLYNQSVHLMKSNNSTVNDDEECKYLVWISYSGLGNQIISLTSAFLLALLSDRVLLVDNGGIDMSDLFCEPFPNVSWILPLDFTFKQFDIFDQKSSYSYGNMVKNKVINDGAIGNLPGYVYVHLSHDYEEEDKLFFCEKDQILLQKIPWMLLRSNRYFVPSLFLIPAYEEELKRLFPKKDTVFHHLGRYLFHPTNSVWGLITRYYQAYLAKADERLGIQIRIFDEGTGPFPYVMDQIFSCLSREKLLADADQTNKMFSTKVTGKSKAVLVTSLTPGYSENLKKIYWEHPTWNGDTVSVHQPSQEGHQQTENHSHNMKAWAEMYLLSLTDELVTSSWSTFGYVAQGLGGLEPWIMTKPVNRSTPDPPCKQAMSMEPCFHAPPFYDCKAKRRVDTGAIVPHVRHCEDMTWGLKLVDRNQW